MLTESDYTLKIKQKYNLREYVTLSDFHLSPNETIKKIPNKPGVYFVIYLYELHEDLFLKIGTGGFFKEKDPNVAIGILLANWIEDADILYIGKAGGTSIEGKISNATLKNRIKQLLRFGNKETVGHWGGRYLWQHVNSKHFKVYWYETSDNENPVTLEKDLISEFKDYYGKRPFANLQD